MSTSSEHPPALDEKGVHNSEPSSVHEKKHDVDNLAANEYNGVEPPTDDRTLAILELVQSHDAHHPMHWPAWQRWSLCAFYCLLQVFVTLTSTTYVSAEFLVTEKFNITDPTSQVVTLGQSLFILGTAVGPAFLGPLSDIGGRKWIYVASIALYAILNFVSRYQHAQHDNASDFLTRVLPTP